MEIKYKLHKFSSGLRLSTVPMPAVKSLTTLALVNTGSRFEVPKEAGIAHFLEHMLLKATKNYPTPLAISTAIDSVGGEHNAFTGKDYTGYYIKVAGKHIELTLDIISDALLLPLLRSNDIAKEKGVIIEEINMYEDDPRRKVSDIFDTVIHKNTPLGRQIIGSKKTVSSFDKNNFTSFLEKWYNLSNIVLVIAGDSSKLTNQASIKKLVKKYFSKGKPRKGNNSPILSSSTSQVSPRLKLIHRETKQAHFFLGFPGLPRAHKNRYDLSVLTTILGGNSSARLFTQIREKHGLAYYAYASSSNYQDTGSIFAFEGVDPSRVDKAITLTLNEIKKLTLNSLKKTEVEKAIDFLTGKLTLGWEDSYDIAITYAKKLLFEDIVETPDQILAKIRKVKKDNVAKLAKTLFIPKKLNLALIGPFKKQAKFNKLLTF